MENQNTTQKPAIKKTWLRILLYMLAFLFVLIITEGIMSVLMSRILDVDIFSLAELVIQPDFLHIHILMQLTSLITTFIITAVFRKYIDRQSIVSMGLSTKGRYLDMVNGFLVGLLLISVGFIILILTKNLEIESVVYNSKVVIYSFIFFLFAAMVEEIVFRGYILNNLLNSMKNKYIALLISALLFALIHGLNPNLSFLSMLNLIIAGLALGITYIYTKNLWFPILLHVSWNYFQGPIFGFEVSGTNAASIINQNVTGNDIITGGNFGFEGSIILTILLFIMIYVTDYIYKRKQKSTN
ncbi:MAG: CPBP family intramembrane metalloprotease [Bacteroidales bacterium]|nr:CPBP family intramembrane metalloprotease [Bacteroidales bacterium]